MKNNTAIILLLLSIGLFYTFTSTQYKDAKELYTLSGEYQNVLKSVSTIIGLRDSLLVTYEAFPKAEIDRINKVLPDSVDTVRLALDLDGMASHYGISIKNIQTTAIANEAATSIVLPEFAGTYNKATISFSFVSSYENFTLLLADIEKSLRIMDVKAVSFQAGESKLYEYHVSVDTYWLKTISASTEPSTQNVGDDLLKMQEELQKVALDQSMFSSPSYLFLSDFNINILQQTTGRPNPFDIIGRD